MHVFGFSLQQLSLTKNSMYLKSMNTIRNYTYIYIEVAHFLRYTLVCLFIKTKLFANFDKMCTIRNDWQYETGIVKNDKKSIQCLNYNNIYYEFVHF